MDKGGTHLYSFSFFPSSLKLNSGKKPICQHMCAFSEAQSKKELLELAEQVSCRHSCSSLPGDLYARYLQALLGGENVMVSDLCPRADPRTLNLIENVFAAPHPARARAKYLSSGSWEDLEAPLCMILMKHLANHALILTLILGIIFKQFQKSIFRTCFVCTENFKDS